MQQKLAIIIAQILGLMWKSIIWIAGVYVIFLIYTLGELQGSLIDRFKELPNAIDSQFSDFAASVTGSDSPAPLPKFNRYSVLLSVSNNLDNAKQMLNRLKEQRVFARIISVKGKSYIFIDSIPNQNQANSILQKVRNKGFPGARIIAPN